VEEVFLTELILIDFADQFSIFSLTEITETNIADCHLVTEQKVGGISR
jgi:hypothetical protein